MLLRFRAFQCELMGIGMLSICGVACLSGCAREDAQSTNAMQTAAPPNLAPLPSSLTDASPLTEQLQRDLDAIMKARVEALNKPQESPDIKETPLAAAPHNPQRRTIIWNERPGGGIGAGAKPQAAGSPASLPPTPPPLAKVNPPLPAATDSPPTAQTPATLKPDRLSSLMVDLSRELYASGAYSNSPLRELLVIASMSLVDPERRIDPAAVPDLTEKERELLGHLQTFFADLGKSLEQQSDAEATIVESLTKLRGALVQEPQLQLPTAALCTRVGGFGDYSSFKHYKFLAHTEQKVIVYLEIDDFTSELNSKGEYVTELSQQLVIYTDRDGIPVWTQDWQAAVDVTKNQRTDFFTVQVVTLPKALSVGKYHLKVRVRDEKSKAEAETAIEFEMVADPKLVGK